MFKKYKVRVRRVLPGAYEKDTYTVDFYVHSRSTRTGFCHEAVVIGPIPRKEGLTDHIDIAREDRRARKSYVNRTWESWSGQSVLQMLWNKLLSLDWVDASCFPKRNPFDSDREPKHETLWDPEELFRG